MRYKIVRVNNIRKLSSAFDALISRATGVPGMGLVHGFTGYGKTVGTSWLVVQNEGIFVRAEATWNPASMVNAIARELGLAFRIRSANQALQMVKQALAESNRPLFVDEADYLLDSSSTRMLDTLRDIHDIVSNPVVLIGMEGIERKISAYPLLARRITQWVEFEKIDLEDTRLVAESLAEVTIGEGLIELLHKKTAGSIGLIIVGLSRIESYAKQQGWDEINLTQWGKRPLFLGRDNSEAEAEVVH